MSTLRIVLTALAFCPHPPLLVPSLGTGDDPRLDMLRNRCVEAVDRLLRTAPDAVWVIGAADSTEYHDPASYGDFARYGVPLSVGLGRTNCAGSDRLPLSVLVGAWLLRDTGGLLRLGHGIAPDADDASCAAVAERITAGSADSRVAVLVMGDGSARRSTDAPGYLDDRAEGFDAAVSDALAAGDAKALRGLDPVLGAELLAAGVPAWRVAGHLVGDRPSTADLTYAEAPFGVGYLVATWLAA